MAIDIHWIRDNDSLGQFCAEWQLLPFVALDTEFMRVDTFYPIAGLLQIGDGVRAYLIDPLTIDNWQPLAALLENPAVVKVVHACSEDLEVLLRLTGSLPAPLFDTQLAAAYLNLGFSMGYSRLVQEVLGIDLPKGETRSDWLQRPLSDTQISYAAEDALHLAEVFVQLRPKLSDEKYAWVLEDGAELVANLRREVDPYEVYRDAKLAGNCPGPNSPCCVNFAPGVNAKPVPVICRATASSVNIPCGRWLARNRTTSARWRKSKTCTRVPCVRTANFCLI